VSLRVRSACEDVQDCDEESEVVYNTENIQYLDTYTYLLRSTMLQDKDGLEVCVSRSPGLSETTRIQEFDLVKIPVTPTLTLRPPNRTLASLNPSSTTIIYPVSRSHHSI
jgi:hypothetical protein